MSAPPRRRRVDPLIVTLRRRRVDLGLRQGDLAEAMSYSREAVSTWESGTRAPTLASLRCWADTLDLDVVLRPRRGYEVPDDEPAPTGSRGRSLEARMARAVSLARIGMTPERIARQVRRSRRTVVRYLQRGSRRPAA